MIKDYLNQAKEESKKSTDLRKPIGVVIVNNFKIIGSGSNQATVRFRPLNQLHKKYCLRKLIGIKRHILYWLCPGCALYRNHAEVRAIRSIKEKNITGLIDMFMYGHDTYCDECAREIRKLGVNNLYYQNE